MSDPEEREPPRYVWYTLDEALDLLAALEDAHDALIEARHLTVVVALETQVRELSLISARDADHAQRCDGWPREE